QTIIFQNFPVFVAGVFPPPGQLAFHSLEMGHGPRPLDLIAGDFHPELYLSLTGQFSLKHFCDLLTFPYLILLYSNSLEMSRNILIIYVLHIYEFIYIFSMRNYVVGSDLMQFLLEHQWNIFIGLEVASLIFLLIFLVIRYAFTKQRISGIFLGLFILCIVLESVLAWFIYQETGEIDTFQIVIAIFIVYAFTFGIGDFKKLDRFIKKHVGKWRGIDLLTEEDIR